MDDEIAKFYEQMKDEELQFRKDQYSPGSHDYRNALTEYLRRQKNKEKENKQEQKEIKEDQRQIKKMTADLKNMTAAILALTILLLFYALAQYFLKP